MRNREVTASTAANEEKGMNAAMEAVSSEPDGVFFFFALKGQKNISEGLSSV